MSILDEPGEVGGLQREWREWPGQLWGPSRSLGAAQQAELLPRLIHGGGPGGPRVGAMRAGVSRSVPEGLGLGAWEGRGCGHLSLLEQSTGIQGLGTRDLLAPHPHPLVSSRGPGPSPLLTTLAESGMEGLQETNCPETADSQGLSHAGASPSPQKWASEDQPGAPFVVPELPLASGATSVEWA